MMMNSKLFTNKQLLPNFTNIRPNLWLVINCNFSAQYEEDMLYGDPRKAQGRSAKGGGGGGKPKNKKKPLVQPL
jgi:hypothetical protein